MRPPRVTEDTQQAIAEDLGVSQDTVYNAKRELQKNGKLTELGELNTDEKREQVREFIEDTPDKPRDPAPGFTACSRRY